MLGPRGKEWGVNTAPYPLPGACRHIDRFLQVSVTSMMNEIIMGAPNTRYLGVGAGLRVGVGAERAPGKLGSGRTVGEKPRNLEDKRGITIEEVRSFILHFGVAG